MTAMDHTPPSSWLRLWMLPLMLGGAMLTAQAGMADRLQIVDAEGTPSKFSAHQPQELCFFVAMTSLQDEAVVAMTFEGPKGELEAKTGVAGGDRPVCFTAPAIAEAGKWRGCTPPRTSIPEAYLVSAKFDRVGATAELIEQFGDLEPDSFVWKVERRVTDLEPKPEECTDLDGEWTWTFGGGSLECKNLPMKLTLPGFVDAVSIATDGEGLEGVQMTITGSAKSERVVLVRQSDVRRDGRYVAAWKGTQDISGLLEQRGEIPGRYSLVVMSSDRLEGKLEVDRMRMQDDVCSISWPFHVTR